MVETWPSKAQGIGLIPGWGAKTPHDLWPKTHDRSNIVKSSIKTVKMVHNTKFFKEEKGQRM